MRIYKFPYGSSSSEMRESSRAFNFHKFQNKIFVFALLLCYDERRSFLFFIVYIPTNTAPAPLFGFGICPRFCHTPVSGLKQSYEANDLLLYPPIQNITSRPSGLRLLTGIIFFSISLGEI